MTAINIVKQRDRVHVITDSAYWQSDGTVVCFAPKALALPNAPGVIATRGPISAPFEFGVRLSRVDTFDTLVEVIEEVMPILYENSMQQYEAQYGAMANVDLILAGWSAARNRPEAYFIHSAPNSGSEERAAELLDEDIINPNAFKLQELTGGVVFAPTIAYEKRAEAGFDEDLNERDYPAVLDGMRKLLELQRRVVGNWDDTEFYSVGGYATITTVTKDGVEQRVFHRWEEDKIGELIQPGPLDLGASNVIQIATPPTGMNRQQRRAWERQQKKRGGK